MKFVGLSAVKRARVSVYVLANTGRSWCSTGMGPRPNPHLGTTAMMREKLEGLDVTLLAVLCQKLAEDPSVSPLVAEQAHALKLEWASLVRKITPPLPDVRAQDAVEADIERVRMRMIELLAGN
jgi:hypothetical protein